MGPKIVVEEVATETTTSAATAATAAATTFDQNHNSSLDDTVFSSPLSVFDLDCTTLSEEMCLFDRFGDPYEEVVSKMELIEQHRLKKDIRTEVPKHPIVSE
jgi:hypothetical protein